MFLGIIIGILLTVVAAWITDSAVHTPAVAASTTQADTAGASCPPPVSMVNWAVVGQRFSDLGANVKEAWNRLTGSANNTTNKSGT